MPVNLKKGQKVDITKGNAGLNKLLIGMGWDVNRYDSGNEFDLDTMAYLLGANGKVTNDGDFVFFGNMRHASGCAELLGDNRTGEGEGDDEQIVIDLSLVPSNIERISFAATIYEAMERGQNFGMVENAYIRVVDAATQTELVRYDLCEDFSIETSVVVGELYRHNGEWKFNAIGSGYNGGLAALCTGYGVNV